MKKVLVAGLVLAGLAVMASPSQAHGLRRRCKGDCDSGCQTACAHEACAPAYVEKTITCYRPVWKEKDVTCTVNRCVPREVVTKHTYTVQVPEWKDEKRTVTVYVQKPKEVEREVVTCHRVPVCADACGSSCGSCGSSCDDGCCGRRHHRRHRHACCETPCEVVREVHKVKCTVMECVPEKREVTVKVCTYRAEQKTYETRCTVYDLKPETVTRKVRYCEMEAYQKVVKVPASTCCN